MRVQSSVNYPKVSESIPDQDITILKSVEETIMNTQLFSDSPLTWKSFNEANEPGRHYVLVKDYDNAQLMHFEIKKLKQIDHQDFSGKLSDSFWNSRQ